MTSWSPSMGPHDADLDLIGTFAALSGLFGQRVAVTTSDRGGEPIIVARFEGVLRYADDVSILKREDAEAQFFYVTDEPNDTRLAGFMIHAGCFGGGQAQEGARVRFLQGGVLVDVSIVTE